MYRLLAFTALTLPLLLLTGCANHSQLLLPSAGAWTAETVTLGPVMVCKGGNMDFSSDHKACNNWPLSVPSMPHPETHHAELRSQAAQQYKAPVEAIVLKDVQVTYNSELNGVIRGWKATALAGRN